MDRDLLAVLIFAVFFAIVFLYALAQIITTKFSQGFASVGAISLLVSIGLFILFAVKSKNRSDEATLSTTSAATSSVAATGSSGAASSTPESHQIQNEKEEIPEEPEEQGNKEDVATNKEEENAATPKPASKDPNTYAPSGYEEGVPMPDKKAIEELGGHMPDPEIWRSMQGLAAEPDVNEMQNIPENPIEGVSHGEYHPYAEELFYGVGGPPQSRSPYNAMKLTKDEMPGAQRTHFRRIGPAPSAFDVYGGGLRIPDDIDFSKPLSAEDLLGMDSWDDQLAQELGLPINLSDEVIRMSEEEEKQFLKPIKVGRPQPVAKPDQ